MSPIKNVIVVGATGNVGPTVIRSLLDSGFTVSTLSRSTPVSSHSPSIKSFTTDYSPTSLATAFKGQDAIVSTIGAFGTLLQLKLIDAAIIAGVKRFIPSDFAPNTPLLAEMEGVLPDLYMRLKPKVTVIEYLKQKAAEHPEFTWSAIGSGPLFDWTLKLGFLGTSLKAHTATIIDSGDEPYMTTTRAQIARAIASSLLKSAETANKYLLVTSWITTQNEVVKACENVTGEKFQITRVSSEQRLQDGKELLAKGNFVGIGMMWNVWCHSEGKGHVVGKEDLANGFLDLPAENLEEAVKNTVEDM